MKKTRIHFSSDVFAAVAVGDANTPYYHHQIVIIVIFIIIIICIIIVIVIHVIIVVTIVIKDFIHREAVKDYHSWLVRGHLCDRLHFYLRGLPRILVLTSLLSM